MRLLKCTRKARSVRHVIEVLHTDDLGNGPSLRKLLGRYIAQAKMANQSLAFEFGEHGWRFFDGSLRWPHDDSYPEIDDIQSVESEIPQVVMNAVDQILTRESMKPGLVFAPAKTSPGFM